MATTTIPKKHYVTIQYRGDAGNEDGLLGFASPYTKDSAFVKRKATQDSWAYGGANITIDDEDNCTVVGGGTRGGYGGGQKWDASMLFMAGCYPRIIDNEPVEGFQIAKSVRRYGWNGGGNVKWRITDPRGFDLEISSENFASVLSCSTMVNGVIQGKCVWGRQGANNILLPESSEPYQEATAMTTKVNTKISLKDVNPGDKVEILSTQVAEADKVCYYMGKYFFLEAEEEKEADDRYNRWSNSGTYFLNKKQTEKYLFKSAGDSKKYFTIGSPKVVAILDKIPSPLNKLEVAKTVNSELDRQVDIDGISNPVLLSPTKIDMTKVVTTLVPLGEKITGEWPTVDRYSTDPIVCKLEDRFYLTVKHGNGKYNSTTGQYDYDQILVELREEPTNNSLQVRYTTSILNNHSYYGRVNQRTRVEKADFKVEELEMFRMVVTVGELSGKVFRIGHY